MLPINEVFEQVLKINDLPLLQKFSQAIALSVINEIKSNDILQLTDMQRQELKPIISKGIYNSLVAISNISNDETFTDFIAPFLDEALSSDEKTELLPELDTAMTKLFAETQLTFQSDFLNEQFRLNNITFDPYSRLVFLQGSYDFKGVESDVKKHRDKITTHLKKEGYAFKDEGYIKRVSQTLVIDGHNSSTSLSSN